MESPNHISQPIRSLVSNPFPEMQRAAVSIVWLLSSMTTLAMCLFPIWSDMHSIWWWNKQYPTAFSPAALPTTLCLLLLLFLQVFFIAKLWMPAELQDVKYARTLCRHLLVSSISSFLWVILFVHGYFFLSTLCICVNIPNLLVAYYHRPADVESSPDHAFMNWIIVSGPLAWNVFLLSWNTALVFPWAEHTIIRMIANVTIWTYLLIGLGALNFTGGHGFTLSLAALMWCMALGQMATKLFALQWIFATIIASLLVFAGLVRAVPVWTGRQIAWWRGEVEATDGERQPLISDNDDGEILAESETEDN